MPFRHIAAKRQMGGGLCKGTPQRQAPGRAAGVAECTARRRHDLRRPCLESVAQYCMTCHRLRNRTLKDFHQHREGRRERVDRIFRGQPTQRFTSGRGIALLKRRQHVIAQHDVAAVFEEVELIRHGVQVGGLPRICVSSCPVQERPDIQKFLYAADPKTKSIDVSSGGTFRWRSTK